MYLSTTSTATSQPPRLSTRIKLLFSTGDLSTSIPLAIVMFFQLYFLTDVAGLRPDLAGLAIGIGRAWDAVNDPLFGLLSDRIRSR
jgi:glycoside/pentoside/hexuronide:cation symporter, GPH family